MTRNRAELRRLMAKHKLTSVAVSEIIGYRPETIRAWKAGIKNVSPRALRHLALELKTRG